MFTYWFTESIVSKFLNSRSETLVRVPETNISGVVRDNYINRYGADVTLRPMDEICTMYGLNT